MKHVFYIIIFVFLMTCPVLANAESIKFTLEEAIDRAVAENRDVEIARQRLAELKGLKAEAMAMGLPQLTGVGSYQRMWRRPILNINGSPFRVGAQNTYQAGTELSQLLWDGGRVLKAVKAAKNEEQRGIENIRDAEQQVRFQVKQSYYEYFYINKVIDVLKKQLNQLRSHLASIKERYNKGLESDYALMRQDVEVANIEPELIDAERQKEFLINSLKVLLVIPQETDFTPVGSFDYRAREIPGDEVLVERASSKRPDLLAERLREGSLQQLIGMEKAGYWPNFTFKSTFQWMGQSDNFALSPDERSDSLASVINLSWPIFDGFKTRARVRQARAKFAQQHATASKLEDDVIKDVKNARISLSKARQALQSQQKSLSLARRASSIAGERFEAGLMSQIELLDTINSQARAEQQYLRAAFDCMVAEAALELAVGGEL